MLKSKHTALGGQAINSYSNERKSEETKVSFRNYRFDSSPKLIYFTAFYPYGIGEEWKYHELKALTKCFKSILVVPTSDGGDTSIRKPNIKGVDYHEPLMIRQESRSILHKIFKVLTSPSVLSFLKELVRIPCKTTKTIFGWLNSSYQITRYLEHPFFKSLEMSNDPCILYFFWGRGTSEIVPFLRNKNLITVIKFHRFDLYNHLYPGNYIPYQTLQIKKSDLLLPISHSGQEYFNSAFSEMVNKVVVSPLGTEHKGMAFSSDDGILRIVSCSLIKKVKRIDLMAKAIGSIPSNIEVIWTHIGDGSKEEKAKLESITQFFPKHIHVTMTGFVKSEEVKSYYVDQKVDLFLNSSSSEGIPVSIMEAYSCGIPAIAGDVGGVKEVVNDENGTLLPEGFTASQLCTAILEFYGLSDWEKQKKRDAAFRTFRAKFEAETNGGVLAQLLLTRFVKKSLTSDLT